MAVCLSLTMLVEKGTKLVLEQVVTTIASVADTSEEQFVAYYDRLMPCLKYIISNANTEDLKMLRGKAIECVSLIGLAVGAEKFMRDASEVMDMLLKTQTEGGDLPDDDPQTSYLISAWARICKILGKQFEQYLPLVMGPVMKAASMKPEVALLDNDDMQGVEGDLDWQFVSLGEQQNFGIKTSGPEYLQGMWNYIYPELLKAIDTEPENEVLAEHMYSLAKAKAIVEHYSRSPSTRKRLHTVMEEMVLPVLELIQFVDTRWSSEYNMLSRLHAVRKAVGAELANSENNIEILTEVEWKQAAGIVEVLGPLADATKEINKALKSRFSFYDSDPIFCPSMLCDPRFRGVLIDDMVAVNTLAIEVKKLSDKSSLEPNVKDEHPSCSSSSSGLWSSFDSIPNTTQPAIDNNSEVKDYLNEPRCIETLGNGCLTEEAMAELLKILNKLMLEHFNKAVARQEKRKDEDYDEVVEEQLANEDDEDVYILSKIADIIHSLFLSYKSDFFPYFDQIVNHFVKCLSPEMPWSDHQWALCIFDDVIEYGGPNCVKYQQHFLGPLLSYLSDEKAEVRQAAVYGWGALAQFGGESFAAVCAEAVPRLVKIITDPESHTIENINPTENAISAITKILKYNSSRLNVQELLPHWLSWLPVWEDMDEAPHVYGYLCDLIEANHPLVLGNNHENLPKLIAIIAEAFARDAINVDHTESKRMISLIRQVQGNENMFQACIGQLSVEQQQALHEVLSGTN
uniref:Importin subunit beta-1/Transportin-1-like TPR repeats domain-containing protein n=1 Tax=Timema shepardi TaxID=629360 RepID=A0A7R9AQC3_TIMSH|nr:unnamed protein product [Timema shepardi]